MSHDKHVCKSLPKTKMNHELEVFDANKLKHRKVYKHFLDTGNLIQKFRIEYPYHDLPTMMKNKIVEWAVRKL